MRSFLAAALLACCCLPAASSSPARGPQDISVPPGYRVDKVAEGLTFPTAVVFDDQDRVYVLEAGYSFGETWTTPRLLRLEPDDRFSVVAQGGKNGPWTGAVFYKGSFFVMEGGALEGGRLLKIELDGRVTPLLEGLPSQGDYHAAGPVVGPDGYVYFSIGAMTNAGVVGDDNKKFGWAERFPDKHDIPCQDLSLTGENFQTASGRTGAFSAYGTTTEPGAIVPGKIPCNGAVLRISPRGGSPQLVAWGLRAPVGLAFSASGRLYVVDQGYDDRGSRPVWAAADLLWSVSTGSWYGWPDFSGDRPLSDPEFSARGAPAIKPVLASYPGTPPKPAALLACRAASSGLDFSRSEQFGHIGDAFIAQFGDLTPETGRVLHPVGFKIVRVDADTGIVEDFAFNKGQDNGPASRLGTGGFERPIAARFNMTGNALYVVDFGQVAEGEDGLQAKKETGALWRIERR